jgi:hypothetical protein
LDAKFVDRAATAENDLVPAADVKMGGNDAPDRTGTDDCNARHCDRQMMPDSPICPIETVFAAGSG